MIDPRFIKVIPGAEGQPARCYLRERATVKCYSIISFNQFTDEDLNLESDPLFAFTFVEEEHAVKLMEDLYYGEYTGA